MSNLYQMNHGLPGTGINGKIGETGEKGQSVYFGYINDFFDGVKINLSNCIYVAKRLNKFVEWEQDVHKLNNALLADNTYQNIAEILNPSAYAYYYTGNIYDSDFNGTSIPSVNRYKLDFSNDSQLMSVMLQSADGNGIQFEYTQSVYPYRSNNINNHITNIQFVKEDGSLYTYTDLYDYVKVGDNMQFPEHAKIKVAHNGNTPLITYDSNDAAYLAYKDDTSTNFNDNWTFDTQPVDVSYNKIMAYLNADIEISDTSTESILTTVREIVSYASKIGKLNLLTETNLFDATYSDKDVSLQRHIENGDKLYDGNEILDLDPYQFFKTSVIIQSNNKVSDDDVTDSFGYSYYGIPEKDLFYSNINSSMSAKTYNPVALNQSILANGINNYSDAIDTYQGYTRNDVFEDVSNAIKYIVDDNTAIVPSTLKDDFKAGDILYFYLDPNNGTNVTHMVVLSENMFKCTKQQLIDYAQIINPFNIYYNDIYDNRILNNTGSIILRNPVYARISKYYNKSAASIMSSDNDTGFIIANKSDGIVQFTATDNVKNSQMLCSMGNKLHIVTDNISIENMYISDDCQVNAEIQNAIYDSNIILENGFLTPLTSISTLYDKYGYPYIGNYLFASDYFYNTDNMDGYIYGYDVMDGDMTVILQNSTNADKLDMFVPVAIQDTNIYILIWAAANNGIKFYSQMMRVDFTLSMFNLIPDSTKKLTITSARKLTPTFTKCELYVLGDSLPFVKQEKTENVISCILEKPLTSETCKDIPVRIETDTDKYEIFSVYANHTDIPSNTSISVNNWSTIQKQNGFSYVLCASSNIPGSDTYAEYVHTDSGLATSLTGDSSLFDKIANGIKPVTTTDRSILLTVGYYDKDEYDTLTYTTVGSKKAKICRTLKQEYKIIDAVNDVDITEYGKIFYHDYTGIIIYMLKTYNNLQATQYYYHTYKFDDSTDEFQIITTLAGNITPYIDVIKPHLYYENIYVTQPGFSDTRDVPTVTLNMHDSMIDTQHYNTGTLCNQFVTYMDINIEDFNEKWGQFIDNSTNISMSLDINNVISDIEWQKKNIIKDNIINCTTIKLVMEGFDGIEHPKNENYVLLYPSFIKTDSDLMYVSNNEKEYVNPDYTIDTSVLLYTSNEVTYPVTTDIDGKKYISLNKDIAEKYVSPHHIYNGIQENIKLHFENIGINDLNDGQLHLKLLYEFGNPIISSLFLQFAVTNVVITVKNDIKTSTFTATLPSTIQSAKAYKCRLLTYNSVDDYTYSYISNPLHAFTNPLSYTVCPIEYESDIPDMQGSIYKTGSNKQISSVIKFYNSDIYESELINRDYAEIRKYYYMDWDPIRIKKSYLQDNIQNIAVSSYNGFSSVTDLNLFKYVDNSILQTVIDDTYKYMNIVYDGAMMNSKLRDGEYTFFYNNNELKLSRYSQCALMDAVRIDDNKTMEIRDDILFNAIQEWNKEYVNNKKYINDKTFTGSISLYGNGYTQLLNSIDTGQHDDILTLLETKTLSDVYIYNNEVYSEIYNDDVKDNTPENNYYYRTFLHDLDMTYNHKVSDSITNKYQVVSDFDILLKYDYLKSVVKTVADEYADKIDYINNNYRYIMPYSLLYKIYPRICYNIDNDNLNILMLRMPTVENDTDIEIRNNAGNYTLDGRYSLATRYFQIYNGS